MKLLTSKKTLIVGALSLIGSASAVVLSTNVGINLPTFLQTDVTTQVAATTQQVNEEKSYILQGLGADALVAAVQKVGGLVSREFPIINAISALLTDSQVSELGSYNNLRVTEDRSVRTAGRPITNLIVDTFATSDTYIANQTNASALHAMGINGHNITVAILDSGMMLTGESNENIRLGTDGRNRVFAKYDAINGKTTRASDDDDNGHGTHVTGIVSSNLQDKNGSYNGIAPDVNLISVKAFDENGESSYSQVLDGLNWIYSNRLRYRIGVLNLSLGAEVRSNYWDDAINQAVMRLWQGGVVVVTSAGNTGGDLGTITVPGNNPYVITVGAATDNFTPYDYSDDRVTTFSSRGPTYEGFVKPEIVAYGARIKAKFDGVSMATDLASVDNATDYYNSSGTSQAAAIITGTVALMRQMDPSATPDDIKCRLMSTSNAGFGTEANTSPFLKGAGLVDAYQAATSWATGCANTGLDIEADLAGTTHFTGPAHVDANGEFYISLRSGTVLSESTGWGMTAESTGWGMTAESTGWGMTAESTGWGMFSESTGWGMTAESTGWGMTAESTGWGMTAESTGWGMLNQSTGWGVLAESTGWGVTAESTGWGVSIESLGDGTNATSTSTDYGEGYVWDETTEAAVAELPEGI